MYPLGSMIYTTAAEILNHCLRLSMFISAMLHFFDRMRIVFTFFHYSSLYDRISRVRLLQNILRQHFPRRFVGWLMAWFTNRKILVRMNASTCCSRTPKQYHQIGSEIYMLPTRILLNYLLHGLHDSIHARASSNYLALIVAERYNEDVLQHFKSFDLFLARIK